MAEIAILLCWQVQIILHQARVSWQQKLADMTAFTAIVYVVVDISQEVVRDETAAIGSVVALAAFRLCRYVILSFRHGDTGVMAGGTGTVHDSVIVDKGASKGAIAVVDGMAGSTVQGCGYMA